MKINTKKLQCKVRVRRKILSKEKTFEEYAKYVLQLKEFSGVKPRTIDRLLVFVKK